MIQTFGFSDNSLDQYSYKDAKIAIALVPIVLGQGIDWRLTPSPVVFHVVLGVELGHCRIEGLRI